MGKGRCRKQATRKGRQQLRAINKETADWIVMGRCESDEPLTAKL